MKSLLSYKLQEGGSISTHVLKTNCYFERIERLGFPFPQELDIDIVLNWLGSSYQQSILNFNMNNMEKSLIELHGMLNTAEGSMVKPCSTSSTTLVLAIRKGGIKRKKTSYPKGKGKGIIGGSKLNPKKNKFGTTLVS